ncbi:hypothetical protein, partial [Parabacteroides sp. AM08-6]|uniref:hypothetical protein n=1 Tax=Parabacteroides sp. AM08-6 TaxID=2292053 RepID=UPI001F1A53C5
HIQFQIVSNAFALTFVGDQYRTMFYTDSVGTKNFLLNLISPVWKPAGQNRKYLTIHDLPDAYKKTPLPEISNRVL